MKQSLVLVSIFCLLGLGVPQVEQTPPTPAELVARAVALVVTCKFEVNATQGQTGNMKTAKLSQGEREMKDKISLIILLRPGRYVYPSVTNDTYAGHDVWKVQFEPAPPNQPAALPSDDPRLNRAMNNISGFIRIDKSTGAIAHLEGSLKGTMVFVGVVKKVGISVPVIATIFSGKLRVEQKLVGSVWVTDKAVLDIWYFALVAGIPVPYPYVSYTAAPNCAK